MDIAPLSTQPTSSTFFHKTPEPLNEFMALQGTSRGVKGAKKWKPLKISETKEKKRTESGQASEGVSPDSTPIILG